MTMWVNNELVLCQARRELGAKWKLLSAEEKEPFIRQTAAQKQQYKNEMEDLKKQKMDSDKAKKVISIYMGRIC